MLIRQATEGDIVKAGRLWLEMIQEMRPDFTPNVEMWKRIARDAMRNGTYFLLVADDGGRINGFLDWFIFPEPSTGKVHLVGQHLFLKKPFRGSGIGKEMYEMALAFGTKMGITTFELFCFENEKPFWGKRGFAPLRTLMRKEI